MKDIADFFSKLFNADSWPARWNCGRWTPFHGWLYIVSNIVIAIAYFSIPLLLLYLIRKTKNKLPFQKVFWLFLLFILACGFTHVLDALMFWYPIYRMSALVLFLTAIISSLAVAGLYKIVPAALSLKSPAFLEGIIQRRTFELEESNAYLVKANAELKESQLLTEKLLKQKDEFIGVASHELKTPVTSLKIYTQLLLSTASEPSMGKIAMFSKMDVQINKLTRLINDLLDTTKLEQGELVYHIEKIRLDDTLREITDQMQLAAEHRLVITKIEPISVYGDSERVGQVIMNLINNAVKFSPGKPEVLISLSRQENFALCQVTDFGFGIPQEEKENIFNKFYRVGGKYSDTFPGLGLGLFIVRTIVEKHGGKIWFESEVGKRASFYFTLPVAKD
jgi:two-component system, chemotaxis family, sensor kinase Cph1